MRTKIPGRYAVFGILGALILPLTSAANVKVVIDGYDYISNNNIAYETVNQKIKINSSVVTCVDGQGQPPTISSATTFKTNNVQLGLTVAHYNVSQGRLYLSTESGDVICNGGVYSDELFAGGFD